jgi:putative heme-binding domain-containing protein
VLVNLSTGRVGSEQERERAQKAVDKGFATPESAAALLTAIARTGAKPFAEQVKANLNNPNNAVAEAALFAYQKLGLKDTGAPMQQIGTMKYDDIFAAVQKGGDAKAGQEMYLRAGCIACHTINADEPPKGPILSAVTKIYDRAALTESILKPNAKIAQGFESAFFKTKKGEQVEGFVTREGGDSVDVRNIVGQTVTLEKSEITERGHRPQSMMPEGLLNAFTPTELANLLAYLESLKK